ncbi:hypothetical protein HK405_007975, partial [Cladochytrium tenue]
MVATVAGDTGTDTVHSDGSHLPPAAAAPGAPDRVRVVAKIRPVTIDPRTPIASQPIRRSCLAVGTATPGAANASAAAAAAVDDTLQDLPPGARPFAFDRVFQPATSQHAFFAECCAPLVDQLLQGFNVSIIAYGQTSSGKTFTIGTSHRADTQPSDAGIIPRAVNCIMDAIEVRDLLRPQADSREISIREDRNGATVISGVYEQPIKSRQDLLRCLEQGGARRTTGDTKMNARSSRSHAIFSLLLEQDVAPASVHGSSPRAKRVSKLNIVDLAGSERLKRTGAEGVRFRESVKINAGLLSLGNVIYALSGGGGDLQPDDAAHQQHVSYRDSKLTRLLRDSLGGNSKTLLIACPEPPIQQAEGRPPSVADEGVTPEVAVPETPKEESVKQLVEELRLRTIRGTNAVKALRKASQQVEALRAKVRALEDNLA